MDDSPFPTMPLPVLVAIAAIPGIACATCVTATASAGAGTSMGALFATGTFFFGIDFAVAASAAFVAAITPDNKTIVGQSIKHVCSIVALATFIFSIFMVAWGGYVLAEVFGLS